MRRVRGFAACVLVAGLLGPAPAARAESHTVTSAGYLYVPGDLRIARGDTAELLNVDPVPHNITSYASTRSGSLLFSSDTIDAGERAPVRGVSALKPGRYPYFCTLHEDMQGTIEVTENGGGATPQQPDFLVTPTGGAVPSPTSLTLHDNAFYVTSFARNDVTKLPVQPGGLLGPATPYATGFNQPLGVAFAPDGTMFVADSHAVGTGRVGRVWAIPKGGGAAETVGQVVVDGLPNGRHATNGLAVKDGRLYIANGNNTDDGTGSPPEQPLSGTLLSVPLKARRLPAKASSTLVVEAKGMRNPYDLAFRPGTSELWSPTNGPDALDPWGEDLLHKVDVRSSAADFGFPACVYKVGPVVGQNPAIDRKCSPRHRKPEVALGLHVSANGLAFGPETAPWNGDLFIAYYGNNPGENNAGHKIVRVPITGGKAGPPEDVITLPTPLDVAFGPPGTGLYVADFGSGQILLLRPQGV